MKYDSEHCICLLATQIPKQQDSGYRIPLEGSSVLTVVLCKCRPFGGLVLHPQSPVACLNRVLVNVYKSADKSLNWSAAQTEILLLR
jgi:hypothetical protein